MRRTVPEAAIEAAILALVAEAGPKGSVNPVDAARAAAPGDEDWSRLMMPVRRTAIRLAKEGRIVILRKGRPADPDDFKGVYRLAAPSNA